MLSSVNLPAMVNPQPVAKAFWSQLGLSWQDEAAARVGAALPSVGLEQTQTDLFHGRLQLSAKLTATWEFLHSG